MKKLYPLALLTCLNTPIATQLPHQQIIIPIANAPSLGKFTVQDEHHAYENTHHLRLYDNNTGENIDVWAEYKKGHIDCKIREHPTYQTRATSYKEAKMVLFRLTAAVTTLFFLAAIGQYIYNHFLKKVYFINPVGAFVFFPAMQTAWDSMSLLAAAGINSLWCHYLEGVRRLWFCVLGFFFLFRVIYGPLLFFRKTFSSLSFVKKIFPEDNHTYTISKECQFVLVGLILIFGNILNLYETRVNIAHCKETTIKENHITELLEACE